MAACRRVQLLLWFLVIPACIRSTQGAKSQSIHGDVNAGDNANDGKNAGGALAEAKAGAAASQSRRSSTGWKLAEEEACREDVIRLCSKHSWNNNLAVLECLQDRKEVSRAPCCLLLYFGCASRNPPSWLALAAVLSAQVSASTAVVGGCFSLHCQEVVPLESAMDVIKCLSS